jgi:hypothetical protein
MKYLFFIAGGLMLGLALVFKYKAYARQASIYQAANYYDVPFRGGGLR